MDFFNCFCKKAGPAVREIIPGDGSYDHIAQSQALYGFGHSGRLIGVGLA
jgi:hypothetical protein